MKFVSFTRLGRSGFGLATSVGIVDLTGRLAPDVASLRHAIGAQLIEQARDWMGRAPDLCFSDVTLLPVIVDPSKILCVGLNYESHRAETKRAESGYPTVFTRFADTQIAHGQAIQKPHFSDALDYEGEVAVIIGRGGRNITEDQALSHIAGYACYNDVTVRDWQRHTHQFIPGKNFPGTGAFGPVMVTPDEIGDYRTLPIITRVNGEVVQQAMLEDLIFPIPRLISYISQFTPLSAGDVIVTGTPGGVGDRMSPPRYLNLDDVVEVEAGKLGVLRNRVAGEGLDL